VADPNRIAVAGSDAGRAWAFFAHTNDSANDAEMRVTELGVSTIRTRTIDASIHRADASEFFAWDGIAATPSGVVVSWPMGDWSAAAGNLAWQRLDRGS
jgi:hypothetical protein